MLINLKQGLAFQAIIIRKQFNATDYTRKEIVPGAFFEYSYNYEEKFNIVAGIRGDHNSLFGWFATPRLNLRYQPVEGTTIRMGIGRGQRTANIFAENNSVFASSRQLIFFLQHRARLMVLIPKWPGIKV